MSKTYRVRVTIDVTLDADSDQQALENAQSIVQNGRPRTKWFYPLTPELQPIRATDGRPLPYDELSSRAIRCLESNGINTIDRLAGVTFKDLLAIKGMGNVCIREVRELLFRRGFAIQGDPFPLKEV